MTPSIYIDPERLSAYYLGLLLRDIGEQFEGAVVTVEDDSLAVTLGVEK